VVGCDESERTSVEVNTHLVPWNLRERRPAIHASVGDRRLDNSRPAIQLVEQQVLLVDAQGLLLERRLAAPYTKVGADRIDSSFCGTRHHVVVVEHPRHQTHRHWSVVDVGKAEYPRLVAGKMFVPGFSRQVSGQPPGHLTACKTIERAELDRRRLVWRKFIQHWRQEMVPGRAPWQTGDPFEQPGKDPDHSIPCRAKFFVHIMEPKAQVLFKVRHVGRLKRRPDFPEIDIVRIDSAPLANERSA